MGNGKTAPDWKWIVSLVLSLVIVGGGWAYTLGIAREQLKENTKDIERHIQLTPYHPEVRTLIDATNRRVSQLETQAAVINTKLDQILAIVEKNHG